MGLINSTEYKTTVRFETPITIEGQRYDEYVYKGFDWSDTIGGNFKKAERFFKERLFREAGFMRGRFDGGNAIKDEQDGPGYEDFIYWPTIWSAYHSYFPTKQEIIDNKAVDGNSPVRSMCYCGIYNNPDYYEAVKGIQAEEAKTKAFIEELKVKHEEASKIKIPVQIEPVETGKQQEKAQVKAIIDNIDSAIARSKVNPFVKGEKDKEKVSTLEYVEPDFEKEPYKTNKFLGQFIEQIKDKSGGKLVACATVDTSNMLFWVYVYDAATKEQQHDKCVVLDLNGRIVNAIPKFWRMRDVLKYEDGPEMLKYYIPMTPDNIKTLVDGKPFSFSETGNEAIAMALNKMVNICTILDYNGASTEDKAGICATIQNYLEFIQAQFIMEPTRFRLSAFDPVTKAFTLTQDSLCTRGIYGTRSGPAIPISLRFEQNQPPYLIPQQQPVQTQQGAA